MNFSKYIGLPYKNKGRNFNGVDCYGIVYLIYKEEKNINLPDFSDINYCSTWFKDNKNKENHILDNLYRVWNISNSIDKPYNSFDVMLFYSSPTKEVVNHCGLYIGDNKFISIQEQGAATSAISRFSGYWESKLYKAIRYKGDVK